MKTDPAVVDLGWAVARYDTAHGQRSVTLINPSSNDERGGYAPAESVTVYGDRAIERLRDFLNEVAPKPEATP